MKKLLLICPFFLLLCSALVYASSNWQDKLTLEVKPEDINQVVFGEKASGIILAATNEGLYLSSDYGANFRRIFHYFTEQKGNILSVALKDKIIFAGTKDGLYISHNLGKNWLKSQGGLKGDVFKDVILGKKIYAVSEEGLFVSENNGRTWKRITLGAMNRLKETDTADETVDDGEVDIGAVNVLGFVGSDEKKLAIGAESGLYTLEFAKTGVLIKKVGILSGIEIVGLAPAVDTRYIYVASKDRVYRFLHKDMAVEEIDINEGIYEIRSIVLNPENRDYCILDKSRIVEGSFGILNDVYKGRMSGSLDSLKSEPTIWQLHTAAIKYAEVSPEKIKSWRRRTQVKAFFPEVSLDYDKTVNFDSSDDTYRIGPHDWGASVKWDLADLIYNEHQTSIDVRSKLMVQLRNDILEDLDRLYFERRALQKKLMDGAFDDRDDLVLRIDELTARIDSLTGGYLSDYISRN